MKKNNQNKIQTNFHISASKSLEIDKIKTTNINILLNRVKLNKQKTLKKKIIILSVVIFLISSLAFCLNF